MRMNRRNVLLGLGSLATLSGGVIGTGAFSEVTATREAKVSVASDANAYLQLDATNSSSPLVGQTAGNGTIAFDFSGGAVNASSGAAPAGEGLNPQSVTAFPDAFVVANHGTEGVGVKAEIPDGGFVGSPASDEKQAIRNAISLNYTDAGLGDVDLLFDSQSSNEWTPFDVGEGGPVSVEFDFTGTALSGDLVERIRFRADASQYE